MIQEQLIFPGHSSQGQRYARIQPVEDTELLPLKTAGGDQIYVLFGKVLDRNGRILADSASRPTIIFFYGNAMTLSDCIGFCRTWRSMGANVVGVEYPGYGMSSGKPSETACYAAADAAYDYLLTRSDIDRSKIIPVGLSLGTGVAIDLASRKAVAAMVLFAPYTSMDDMAKVLAPWVPAGIILKHHFLSEEKIRHLKIPILIVHGENDRMIPPEMSRRLARAASGAQVRTLFVDSGHNDIFESAGQAVDAAMTELIQQINIQK